MGDINHQRYTITAIVLHWLTAVLVAWLLVLGWLMVQLPEGPVRREPFSLHKSLGLTVLLLTCCRLLWRYLHPPPPLPVTLAPWRRAAAGVMHRVLLGLLLLQPVLGYLSTSFTPYSTRFWVVPLPRWAPENPALNQLFTDLHAGCGLLLAGCIALHFAGALTHLATAGDRVVARMWPRSRRVRLDDTT